ncbi:response regulator [Ruegeria lacuscaerulensis]|uniref:response regulator n=1 Tax=Ruegeria lacuscaerulensis TaxID=55218 RepID=UPI00147FCF5E|nr:response regulator [Ruegeria lacuscaerulensis]
MKHSNPGNDRFQSKLEMRALRRATLNVLAVDDDPSILNLLQSALPELENCYVSVADSASEALRQIEAAEAPFDCLLVDIQMPETSGIQLLRQIRSMPGNLETPVIMLTAMDDRKYIEEAFLEGAFDYITKPFDFFELRSRMNAAHLLMMERIRTQTSSASIKNLREELDFHQQFSFEDPLSIDGLDRCLRYIEFDNYVEQLSRSCRCDSWVTAVKLQNADYHYDLNGFGNFRRVISDVAECIERTSKKARAVFSYRGSGVFLVVTHGRDCTDMLPTEHRLNLKLRTVLGNHCGSVPLKALVSAPVSMRSITKAGAFAAFKKAIDGLSNREGATRMHAAPQSGLCSAPEPIQKEKGAGRLFDTVMRELYGESTYLDKQ